MLFLDLVEEFLRIRNHGAEFPHPERLSVATRAHLGEQHGRSRAGDFDADRRDDPEWQCRDDEDERSDLVDHLLRHEFPGKFRSGTQDKHGFRSHGIEHRARDLAADEGGGDPCLHPLQFADLNSLRHLVERGVFCGEDHPPHRFPFQDIKQFAGFPFREIEALHDIPIRHRISIQIRQQLVDFRFRTGDDDPFAADAALPARGDVGMRNALADEKQDKHQYPAQAENQAPGTVRLGEKREERDEKPDDEDPLDELPCGGTCLLAAHPLVEAEPLKHQRSERHRDVERPAHGQQALRFSERAGKQAEE